MGEAYVSRETSERLSIYAALLIKWNPRINLVSPSSIAHAQHRHFDDSLQLLNHMPPKTRTWLDLGSGGGFPGLAVAVALADRDDITVTLIEADHRKVAFLRTVVRETGARAEIICKRIEDVDPAPADVISARALAPLPRLLSLCAPFLHAKTTCLFLKGRSHEQELAEAAKGWHFEADTPISATDPESAVLVLKDVRHV